jgi:hypothetical protein
MEHKLEAPVFAYFPLVECEHALIQIMKQPPFQPAEAAELAHPATGLHDLQRVAQHAVANKVEDTVHLGTETAGLVGQLAL